MKKNKIALITGITGQDGSYLAELLLSKKYIVHGIVRRSSLIKTDRIDHLFNNPSIRNRSLFLHYGDMTDDLSLSTIINTIEPDEIYNLAAQSHVKVSFQIPLYTANTDALGTLRLLEIIRGLKKKSKFYQASTSELYGETSYKLLNEKTPFNPVSPYAIAKNYSFEIVKSYRKAYGVFACNGILFNHESPRRGETFVTRKITKGIAEYIKNQTPIALGNIEAIRDWGHAQDYVVAMWKMLQRKSPKDYVIATGKCYSIRHFLETCLKTLNISYKVIKKNNSFKFINNKDGSLISYTSKTYFRPNEVSYLKGDSRLAKKELKWEPKISFKSLVEEMLSEDLKDI